MDRKIARIKTGTGLAVAFGTVFLVTITALGVAYYQGRALNAALQRSTSELAASSRLIHSIQEGLDVGRRDESLCVSVADAAEVTDLQRNVLRQRDAVQTSLQRYRDHPLDAEDLADYQQVESQALNYFRLQDQVLALSSERATPAQREAGLKLLLGDSRQAFETLTGSLQAWVAHSTQLSDGVAGQGERIYHRGSHLLLALGAYVFTACLASVIRTSRTFTGPVALAVDLARGVARGDLTRRVDVSQIRNAEVFCLLEALNEMAGQLSELITGVMHSSDAVRTTANDIARGNGELDQRTKQQAESLQDTAMSMEQITSLGKRNSDHAGNADQFAREVQQLAESGGSVVAQAISAMDAINKGSVQVSEIITVIDDIAFQTNLLALNAAVEAARAGSEGRGFAVVAQEVRALAQRSADAARQIKTLITDSEGKVRAGTELVNRSGLSLSKILDSVREMAVLIKDIANSSREQSSGIQRINQSILFLDGAIRQNAHMVEAGAAASYALQHQADSLSKVAGSFIVEGAAEHGVSAPPTSVPPSALPCAIESESPWVARAAPAATSALRRAQ